MKKPYQGGGNRFGGNGGGYSGGRGGSGSFQKREMTMHKTTCSACGKTCEVPFRPTGEKPVYCKECFAERGGPSSDRNDRSERPSFDRAPRKSFDNRFEPRTEAPRAERSSEGNNDVKKQFEYVNSRLDKLTNLVERLVSSSAVAPAQKAVVVKSPELKALVTKATKVVAPKAVAPKTAAPKVPAKKAKKKGPNKR